MDISIIVPLYKRIEWIRTCIERLMSQDYNGVCELILVDDGSSNGTEIKKICEESAAKSGISIRYLRHHHAGPAATRNYGVKSSSGRIICFLDDDSLPGHDWLREITGPFTDSPLVSLVSGRTLSFNREGLPLLLEQSVYPAKSWATCNIAYRRDAFEALGGFDEYYAEPSWEDNDLGLRARWAGYTHYYNARAIVYHPHEKSIPEYKNKCILNGRGAAAFSRKYVSKKPFWSIVTPVIMSRWLLYGIFPWVWIKRARSPYYLRFLWSFCSLQGFMKALFQNGETGHG